MSEVIKHECGIALIRLLKPIEHYYLRYGTAFYGLNKLHLLMEKQHNRGQDGAGLACIKFDLEPGHKYIDRIRSGADAPLNDIFLQIHSRIQQLKETVPGRLGDITWLKQHFEFCGELYLGHLRYGTYGGNLIGNVHPVIRENNWKTKNLVLAGNFNLTNVDEMFGKLIELGQFPVETSDTVTMLEKIGHFLDEENERLYQQFKAEGYSKREISHLIAEHLDIGHLMSQASVRWDGGYVIAGLLGHGDAFVTRDPWGIRPAYYYKDEEVVVVASERPAIQTAFNLTKDVVHEVKPGTSLIIKKSGAVTFAETSKPAPKKSCSFERIYFSRGTDADIYKERKQLGAFLAPLVLEKVDYDFEHTVFSYIPNTAAVAFYGFVEELNRFCNQIKKDQLLREPAKLDETTVSKILALSPRIEKVAVKDIKLRTFITQDVARDDLVTHVYDVTYGIVRPGVDTLVVLDDSIVRGTTLKQSIIRILDRLGPKHIVIASSAPQIRYPDCYGIDMAKLSDFVAFQAAIALLKETNQAGIIGEVYQKCKKQMHLPKEEMVNHVKDIYRPFTAQQIADKIARLVTASDVRAKVTVVFNSIENLHQACPGHTGDWYFTGNYPTPGGIKVACQSFINFVEGKNIRAY